MSLQFKKESELESSRPILASLHNEGIGVYRQTLIDAFFFHYLI